MPVESIVKVGIEQVRHPESEKDLRYHLGKNSNNALKTVLIAAARYAVCVSSRFDTLCGTILSAGIRQWIRMSGRGTDARHSPWLDSPFGSRGAIGATFYLPLAKRERLSVRENDDNGLLESFDALGGPTFDPDKVHDLIREFYEHTSRFEFDVWSEAAPLSRVFLWALTRFVSQSMDQLNFPVSSLELAHGMSSGVVTLHKPDGARAYTIWLRRLNASGRMIYTEFCGIGQPPLAKGPCLKVSFPLPHGSSTVFLKPINGQNGAFRLESQGEKFGDSGFYRMVAGGKSKRWHVRYLASLHEKLHLYVDEKGILRTDHTIAFMGMTILRLHYRMARLA